MLGEHIINSVSILTSPASPRSVDTVRDGSIKHIDSPALVPGDIIVVHTGTLPCDCVLLRGEAILDENMLTGETGSSDFFL